MNPRNFTNRLSLLLKTKHLAVMLSLMAFATPAFADKWEKKVLLTDEAGFGMKDGPSAVAWLNQISVFIRGADDALWWNTMKRDGQFNWVGWQSLGGTITSSPSCIAVGNFDIYCFARGMNNALWMTSYTNHVTKNGKDIGPWNGWTPLGGSILGAPSATTRGRVPVGDDLALDFEVYARSTDRSLMEFHYIPINGVYDWFIIGGSLTTDAGCSSLPPDPHDPHFFASTCYAMNGPQTLGEWADWTNGGDETAQWYTVPVAGQTAFQPSLVFFSMNEQEVYVTGLNQHLWRLSWRVQSANGGWGQWEDVGGWKFQSGPSCVSAGPINYVQTFCFGQVPSILGQSVGIMWSH